MEFASNRKDFQMTEAISSNSSDLAIEIFRWNLIINLWCRRISGDSLTSNCRNLADKIEGGLCNCVRMKKINSDEIKGSRSTHKNYLL